MSCSSHSRMSAAPRAARLPARSAVLSSGLVRLEVARSVFSQPVGRRYAFLSFFGPLSLFALMGVWAVGLITGFALLHWSLGTPLTSAGDGQRTSPPTLYFSGTTFFTLGYGDVVPATARARR